MLLQYRIFGWKKRALSLYKQHSLHFYKQKRMDNLGYLLCCPVKNYANYSNPFFNFNVKAFHLKVKYFLFSLLFLPYYIKLIVYDTLKIKAYSVEYKNVLMVYSTKAILYIWSLLLIQKNSCKSIIKSHTKTDCKAGR